MAKEREEILTALAVDMIQRSNEGLVGKTVEVLVEDEGVGRGKMDAPEIDSLVLIEGREARTGRFLRVEITGLEDLDMKGKVVDG